MSEMSTNARLRRLRFLEFCKAKHMKNVNAMSLDERLQYELESIPENIRKGEQIENRMDTISTLLAQKPNLLYRDNNRFFNNYTYEILIIQNKPIEFFELLLDYGLDVNFENPSSNQSLLNLCIVNERYDYIELLLNRGADIEGRYMITPFVTAVSMDSPKICEILLSHGLELSEDDHKLVLFSARVHKEWDSIYPPLKAIKDNKFDEWDVLKLINTSMYREIKYLSRFNIRVVGKIRSILFKFMQKESTELLLKYIIKYKYFKNNMMFAMRSITKLYHELCEYEAEQIYLNDYKNI
jgi:hypothetical protein